MLTRLFFVASRDDRYHRWQISEWRREGVVDLIGGARHVSSGCHPGRSGEKEEGQLFFPFPPPPLVAFSLLITDFSLTSPLPERIKR